MMGAGGWCVPHRLVWRIYQSSQAFPNDFYKPSPEGDGAGWCFGLASAQQHQE